MCCNSQNSGAATAKRLRGAALFVVLVALAAGSGAAAKPSVLPSARLWTLLDCTPACSLIVVVADRWAGAHGTLQLTVQPVDADGSPLGAAQRLAAPGDATAMAVWQQLPKDGALRLRLSGVAEVRDLPLRFSTSVPTAACTPAPPPATAGSLRWPVGKLWRQAPGIYAAAASAGASIIGIQDEVAVADVWLVGGNGAIRCVASPTRAAAYVWPRSGGDPWMGVRTKMHTWWATVPLATLLD